MSWSEGCGVTGLEIKDGDTMQTVVLTPDNRQSTGPAAAFGALRTCAVTLKYDGDGDGRHFPPEDGEVRWRRALFYAMANVTDQDPTSEILVDNGKLNSGDKLWFGGGESTQFLGDVKAAEHKDKLRVGKLADAAVKDMRRAMLEYCGTDQIEARPREARQVFRELHAKYAYKSGMPDYSGFIASAVESRHTLDWFLKAYHESFVLLHGMYEVRRPLTPTYRVGPTEGGHEAVGELARFVRRKAMHAGFGNVGDV